MVSRDSSSFRTNGFYITCRVAAIIVLASCATACGNLRTEPLDGAARIDGAVRDALPAADSSTMVFEPSLKTAVVVAPDGAGARYLRDYLLARPLGAEQFNVFLKQYPFLSVADALNVETPEGPTTVPIPDLFVGIDGTVNASTTDVLLKIDWTQVTPERFSGVDDLGLLLPELTFDSMEAATLTRMAAWMLVSDTQKIRSVQPIPVYVRPTDIAETSQTITAGQPGFCPCLEGDTEPYLYDSTRVLTANGSLFDCGEKSRTTGTNLLTLTRATLSNVHETANAEGRFRAWYIPEEDFPIHLPGLPTPLVPVPLPSGIGVYIGDAGQFEESVPPHAHESQLPGQFRGEEKPFCEWTTDGLPQTLVYANRGEWSWRSENPDERIGVMLYESDECWCWWIFCLCNPDDFVGIDVVRRGDTLSTASTYTNFDGAVLQFRTIPECRNQPEEICDGLDNNCNGDIDESDPGLDAACPDASSVCIQGKVSCTDGHKVCVGAVEPKKDVCNGIDDDCDGDVDDDDPRVGVFCGNEIGACAPGVLSCIGGALTCVGGQTPGAEICSNNLDDDCDGSTDEFPCECVDGATRPCGVNKGACTHGTQTCASGTWGTCLGGTTPVTETCNDFDDDCDGSVDEDCPCAAGQVRTCGSAGNVGACKEGVQTCLASGKWSLCAGGIEPAIDVCDSIDNDCDGTVDNIGYGDCDCVVGAVRSCGVSQGECTIGTQTCVGGKWNNCSGMAPTSEGSVCNNKDDNCNGAIDEGLVNLCLQCGPSPVEVCNFVDDDCDGLVDESNDQTQFGLRNACDGCGPLPLETCNDIDDDCNGVIDDGVPDCGLEIVWQPFELHGGSVTGSITLPNPQKNIKVPIVLIDSYRTNGDDDYEFSVVHQAVPGGLQFDFDTDIGNGGSSLIGRVAILGIGVNGAASTLPFNISNGTCSPAGPLAVAKGTPLAAEIITTYHTNADDDFAYFVEHQLASPGTFSFNGCGFTGNGGSYISGLAMALGIPKSVTVEERQITVVDGVPATLTWSNPSGMDAFPLVSPTAYMPANDDDASWSMECKQTGAEYQCLLKVNGGNSSSAVTFRGALLRGPIF